MNRCLSIVTVGVIFYIIDILTIKGHYMNCRNTIKTNSVLLIHHIINIFAQFGWMCDNKYILYAYLFAPLIVLMHWKTNDNKCVLTQYVNDNCNIDQKVYFRDIWWFLGIKKLKKYDLMHKSYLITVWFIALIKLYLLR